MPNCPTNRQRGERECSARCDAGELVPMNIRGNREFKFEVPVGLAEEVETLSERESQLLIKDRMKHRLRGSSLNSP